MGQGLACLTEPQSVPVGPVHRSVHDYPPAQQRLHEGALSPNNRDKRNAGRGRRGVGGNRRV